jgi:limonene-1,2-epoxide hydrolase
MITVSATATVNEPGLLTKIVEKYGQMIEHRATAAGSSAADWEPFTELVAVDEFKRVGAYMEVMSWPEYVKFLTAWAGSTRFEMTIFRISEIGRVVIQEIEERHYKGDEFIRKNVIAVYEFDDRNKLRHLDIYEQAKDTGRWIAEAAQASLNPASA